MNQDSSRKMVIISILITPLLYILIASALRWMTEVNPSELQVPFTVLIAAGMICEFISILYVYNNWKLNDDVDLPQKLVKDIIRLAIYHVIVLLGLVYFLLAYAGIL